MKEETIDIGTVGDDLLQAYEQGLEDGKPKWIPVNEKLPTARKKVLVAYKNGVTIAERNGYLVDPKTVNTYWRGVHGSKHQLTSVTHWMPLPEPPKEETDG